MSNQKIEIIKISELQLWSENPRDPINSSSSDFEIIKRALETKKSKWTLQKFVEKMGAYYDFSELPTVVIRENKYVVYDGNRRIAIIKYFQNQDLYNQLDGGLFFDEEENELKELVEIPCNVCDLDTALKNVERKHTSNGSWGELERDYFLHYHKNQPKSKLVWLDEKTQLLNENPKMSQRFVKDEILTNENLKKIGFNFDANEGFISNYSEVESLEIFNKIGKLIENENLSTRNNRGQLLKPLIDNHPELKTILKPYDSNKEKFELKSTEGNKNTNLSLGKQRKTQATKAPKILFGRELILEKGKVNDLYLAISRIYDKDITNDKILPIIGISLRLLIEVAARVYYEDSNKDKIYDTFLKLANKEMQHTKQTKNYFSLTNDWLNQKNNLEALLGKYAHGNIDSKRGDILSSSIIIGDILEYYFKRANKI